MPINVFLLVNITLGIQKTKQYFSVSFKQITNMHVRKFFRGSFIKIPQIELHLHAFNKQTLRTKQTEVWFEYLVPKLLVCTFIGASLLHLYFKIKVLSKYNKVFYVQENTGEIVTCKTSKPTMRCSHRKTRTSPGKIVRFSNFHTFNISVMMLYEDLLLQVVTTGKSCLAIVVGIQKPIH